MRILYAAIDQTVPGTKGGSVHVAAVAEGLAALGHDVMALVTPGSGTPAASRVTWVPMRPPLGSTHLCIEEPLDKLVECPGTTGYQQGTEQSMGE